MHDVNNHNMGTSAAKSLGIVSDFHSAWKVVTPPSISYNKIDTLHCRFALT